jgi:hypothetical protein
MNSVDTHDKLTDLQLTQRWTTGCVFVRARLTVGGTRNSESLQTDREPCLELRTSTRDVFNEVVSVLLFVVALRCNAACLTPTEAVNQRADVVVKNQR